MSSSTITSVASLLSAASVMIGIGDAGNTLEGGVSLAIRLMISSVSSDQGRSWEFSAKLVVISPLSGVLISSLITLIPSSGLESK